MKQDIHIVGCGQTPFGELWSKDVRDLMEDAMSAALEDSPCTSLDIDMIVVANMLAETVSYQANLGSMASLLLPHRPPALRVEAACASGSVAMHTAISLLESGRAKNVLVVGVEKMTDVSGDRIAEALMGAADASKDAPHGLTFPGLFGLIARRYMHDYDLTRDELNVVSAVHHANAMTNPYAQFKQKISAESVGRSAPVADPLRLLDCSPISDGAAACILSTEHKSPVKIIASELANDSLSIADRATLTSFSATKDAMERALEEANIGRKDIRTLEIHDCFSIAAVINLEDLGFAAPGKGIAHYLNPDPSFAVNASGGLKACGHPVGATGVKQIIDVRKQLLAGKCRYGLAHNFGGAGASCCIHILENSHAA